MNHSVARRDAKAMTRPIIVVAIARAASLTFSVVLLAVLGRRLGPAGFGHLQLAIAVMAYPTLLVDLGLTTFGLRELARGASPDVIRVVLGARIALAGVVTAAIVIVAVLAGPADPVTSVYLVLALGLPASALNARWVLQGEHRFGRAALLDIATAAMQLGIAALLVRDPDDTPVAALSMTVGAWVMAMVSLVVAGPVSRFRPRLRPGVAATIARSFPLGAAGIAITIYYSIGTVLLGVIRGAEDVAFYAAAYRIIVPVTGLAAAVGTVAIAVLSSLQARDPRAADRAAVDLARRLVLVSLPVAVGGTLAAEPIIQLVYGPTFTEAIAPFRILVWSVATVYLNAAFAFLLLARGGDRAYLGATAVGALVNVSLNLIVIPIAGPVGTAAVTIVSELVVLSLLLWFTRDVATKGVALALQTAGPPTIAMAIVVWFIRDSMAVLPIGALVYGVVAVLTGAISIDELLQRSEREGA